MESIPLSEAQLEVLSKPRTREVFDAFMRFGAMGVPEVQRRMGTSSKTIYYHVAKLAEAGILREQDGVYRPTSTRFFMPSGFQGERYEELAAKTADLQLRRAARRYRAAAEASGRDPSLIDDQYQSTNVLRLSSADRAAMRDELRALVAKYQRRENPESDRTIALVVVSSPIDFDRESE